MIVWSYTFCQRCFVWSLIIVLAVMGTVTSHTGVQYVSNLAIMLESTGCNRSYLQHCRKQFISLEVGVTHNSWCTIICGSSVQREPAKIFKRNEILIDETAIFMATHLQDIINWQIIYCFIDCLHSVDFRALSSPNPVLLLRGALPRLRRPYRLECSKSQINGLSFSV